MEHSISSSRSPLCLNNYPGVFAHDYRVDRFPPSPLPAVPRDPAAPSIVQVIRTHYAGMYSAFFQRSTSPEHIDPRALEVLIDQAVPRYSLFGRTPIVAIGKDVPHEEFRHEHAGLGYRQRLAGPGPQATNTALLQQHGVDPFVLTPEQKMAILPPFIDMFAVISHCQTLPERRSRGHEIE